MCSADPMATSGAGLTTARTRLVTLEELANCIAAAGSSRRTLIAVVGAPGSGKSTLAEQLAQRLNAREPSAAAVLPMDGYHYDDRILIERSLRPRKGTPETFDVGGLLHMLERLRRNEEEEIAVPIFDRELEISRSSARMIPRAVRYLIVEGNYLLLNRAPWSALRPMFDLTVAIDVPEAILRERLVARWRGYGFAPCEIDAKVEGNDLPNGREVVSASESSDFCVRSQDE
jgi:pantothenate kinase